jgi:hypothetical protein
MNLNKEQNVKTSVIRSNYQPLQFSLPLPVVTALICVYGTNPRWIHLHLSVESNMPANPRNSLKMAC